MSEPPPTRPVFTRRPPRTLQRRFMAFLAFFILLTVLLVGAVFAVFTYQSEQAAVRSRLVEAAHNASQNVSNLVRLAEVQLDLAASPNRYYLLANPLFLDEMLRHNAELLEIVRLDETGQVIASATRGRSLLSGSPGLPQTQWFSEARAGQLYLGGARIAGQEEPYLIIAVPAHDQGDVVVARLSAAVLARLLADFQVGQGGETCVISAQGDLLAHSDPAVLEAAPNLAGRPEYIAIRQAESQRWYGSYTSLTGLSVVGASDRIEGTGWIVLAELEQAEAFNTSRTALFLLGGWLLVVTITLLFASRSVMGRLIFEPLEKLRQGALRLGSGDLEHRIRLQRRDEIGVLGGAFDHMAAQLEHRQRQVVDQAAALVNAMDEQKRMTDNLQQLTAELEQRVDERTAELAYQSTHDALTGLYNRLYFEQEMARLAAGRRTPVSIIVADMDRLKYINDNLGHAAGDEYLRRAADIFKAVVRAEDVVARLGGDEFAILLPETPVQTAREVEDRILEEVMRLVESGAYPFLSLSTGASEGSFEEALVEVFKRADAEMYRWKDKKRDRLHGGRPQ